MSVTISSDVLPILTLTWQPVAFSHGVPQSTFLSLEPSSPHPAHAMMFSWPSPAPSFCCIGIFGTWKPAAALVPPPPPPPLSLPPPQPAAANRTAQIAAVHVARLLMVVPPPGTSLRRSRTSAP